MEISKTSLPGVMLMTPPQFEDSRGAFCPVFAERLHREAGYSEQWAEMNLSHTKKNSIRGLHFQDPQPQSKLITVVAGSIFDVVLDLRRESPTYGMLETFTLSAGNDGKPSQIYIPEGLAHGLATPECDATIAYLVSSAWMPDAEQTIAWDDPDLAIAWPVSEPNISEKDAQGVAFASLLENSKV